MGLLAGWLYYAPITVGNGSVDYPTKITVYYGSGTNGLNVVYCNSLCQPDFDDLRFTKADGETLMPYWIESYVDSTSAVVWVKHTEASPTAARMYYGKADATAVSSGADTFLKFDDFNDNSFDTAKWGRTNSADILEQNARIEASDAAGAYKNVVSLDTFANQFELRALIQKVTATTSGYAYVNMGDVNTNHDACSNGAAFFFDPDSAKIICVTKKAGVTTTVWFTAVHAAGTYYWLILQRLSTGKVKYIIESATHTAIENQTPNSTPTLSTAWYVFPIQAAKSAATTQAYCDVTFIKKFADTEPTFTFGSQQTGGRRYGYIMFQDPAIL